MATTPHAMLLTSTSERVLDPNAPSEPPVADPVQTEESSLPKVLESADDPPNETTTKTQVPEPHAHTLPAVPLCPLVLPRGVSPVEVPQQLASMIQALTPLLLELASATLETHEQQATQGGGSGETSRAAHQALLRVWALLGRIDRVHAIIVAPAHECFDPVLRGNGATVKNTYSHAHNRHAWGVESESGWVVGKNTYSNAQGYKSVSWRLTFLGGEYTDLVVGVVDAHAPAEFTSGVDVCDSATFRGWHNENGGSVFCPELGRYELYGKRQTSDFDMFTIDNKEAEVNLDLVQGKVTFTRLTGGRHTHTYIHTVPVGEGQAYRLCLDMVSGAGVELVHCEGEL